MLGAVLTAHGAIMVMEQFIHHIEVRHSYDCSLGEVVKLSVLVEFR